MGNLLFSKTGRIGPSECLKGMVILGVIAALFHLLMLRGSMIGGFGIVIGFLIILYPMIAVLAKRAHDAGKSGWMGLLFAIAAIVIYFVLGAVADGFIATDLKQAFETAMLDVQGSTDPNEMLAVMTEYGDPYAAASAIPSAILAFVSLALTGVLANLILKSDDHENQYGPQT